MVAANMEIGNPPTGCFSWGDFPAMAMTGG